MKIELRKPLMSDAKRYFEILSHPEFYYFLARPKTIKEQRDVLRSFKKHRENGSHYAFAVTANGRHVGGAGIKINPRFSYLCEIGYFVDRKYWNKGITTKVIALLEKYIAENLTNIVRVEIIMAKENIGSQKVAIKSGYKKEGLMKKRLKIRDHFYDCWLYAKITR